ncbi:MAG: hypothetical protein ACK5NG_05725, partial [Chthoniobacterales bacterium]
KPLPLRLIAANRYQAEIPLSNTQESQLFFLPGQDAPLITPARTRKLPATNEKIRQRLQKLATASGGTFFKNPEEISEKIHQINSEQKDEKSTPLAPFLLILAILLFSSEILHRHLRSA